MGWIWMLAAAAFLLACFLMGARLTGGGRERVTTANRRRDGKGGRDLGANVNPSQTGNEKDLWPDRTGARTRTELGARHAVDMTFAGDREEHHGRQAMGGPNRSDPARPAPQPGVRREVADGSVEPRPASKTAGQGAGQATADLDPEDAYGEDRPAVRTSSPDQPPTQFHPEEHGVPGDHLRFGHHRSATAPERRSSATDPAAHAPAPGPNHVPPAEGVDFPGDIQP